MLNSKRPENHPATGKSFVVRVIFKAAILFILLNLLFGFLSPLPALGRLSAYNYIFPGRLRLPYGENPQKSYNLSLFNLEAMFASHELAVSTKPASEFRVILIGDSSTWGFLVPADQTLAAWLDRSGAYNPDGRRLRFYNLGYPVMSLTKDLLILDWAMRYEPDMIIWLVTLESFPQSKQLYPPVLQQNPHAVQDLNQRYNLTLMTENSTWEEQDFWAHTIVGARRQLADLLRLQLYGVLWAATGIDQDIPETYTPRSEDLKADSSYSDWSEPPFPPDGLSWQILAAGMQAAQDVPVLLVNEPMFISEGANSDIRYNFYYPRWAYDSYRIQLHHLAGASGWNLVDLWNSLPGSEFTNTAVHRTVLGEKLIAEELLSRITDLAKFQK